MADENQALIHPSTDDETATALRDIFNKIRDDLRPPQSTFKTSKYVFVVTIVISAGRALSCTFRYVTTREGLRLFLEESFIHQGNKRWSQVGTDTFALIFCLSDMLITLGSAKRSIEQLCHLVPTIQHKINLLREGADGRLSREDLFKLGLLAVAMPGCMLGSFYKGVAGVTAMGFDIADWLTTEQPAWLSPTLLGMGYFAGVLSAICNLAFQGVNQGLDQMLLAKALRRSPAMREFEKKNYWRIRRNIAATFWVSIAMASVNMTAKCYAEGSFKIDLRTLLEVLTIAFSNLIVNTLFTSGPKYLHSSIEKWCQPNSPDTVSQDVFPKIKVLFMAIGFLSSIGTCIAPFSSVMHTIMFSDGKKELSEVNTTLRVIGIVISVLFAIFLFPRDYTQYTKQLLEMFLKKPSELASDEVPVIISAAQDERAEIEPPKPAGWCSWVAGLFCASKKDPVSHSINGDPLFARTTDVMP